MKYAMALGIKSLPTEILINDLEEIKSFIRKHKPFSVIVPLILPGFNGIRRIKPLAWPLISNAACSGTRMIFHPDRPDMYTTAG